MSYVFYLGDTMLPVAPSQLQLKVKNQNKAVTLINEGEVNLLKHAGLTEIIFKALLPNEKYPFAQYNGRFRDAKYFLGAIRKLKAGTARGSPPAPFQFIVSRTRPDGKILFDTNIKVSLEDYKIVESEKDGFDVTVEINLKQYHDYGTKIVSVRQAGDVVQIEQPRPAGSVPKIESYTVVSGDHLWAVAAKCLGSGERYPEMYQLNQALIDAGNAGTDNTKYTIHAGQILQMPM